MATLVLVRHGQASYGQADYDRLSPRGEQQARTLGPHLAAMKLDALFVGPLRRQQQTAAFAREAAALPEPTTLPELAEYPAFELVTRLLPKLVAEDPTFAALPANPTRELADRAFKRILHAWARDEWQLEGVERVTDFSTRVRTGLERAMRRAAAASASSRARARSASRSASCSASTEHRMVRTCGRDPQRLDHRARAIAARRSRGTPSRCRS